MGKASSLDDRANEAERCTRRTSHLRLRTLAGTVSCPRDRWGDAVGQPPPNQPCTVPHARSNQVWVSDGVASRGAVMRGRSTSGGTSV